MVHFSVVKNLAGSGVASMKNGMQRTLLSVGVEFGKSSFVTAVRQGRVQISALYPVEVFATQVVRKYRESSR